MLDLCLLSPAPGEGTAVVLLGLWQTLILQTIPQIFQQICSSRQNIGDIGLAAQSSYQQLEMQ